MIGRANIIEADPSRIDEGVAFVRDQVKPLVDSLPGSRGLGMWANRETGQVVISTVWEDRSALESSEGHVAPLRAEAAKRFGAGPVRVEIAELVLVWQAAPDQPGYWTRSTEMTVPMHKIEDGIAMTRDEVLPDAEQIPGLNTYVLLVNRDTGYSAVNATYRTRAELVASRERARDLRATSVARLGATQPVVREMETIIVGIRGAEIPEQAPSTADRPEQTPR